MANTPYYTKAEAEAKNQQTFNEIKQLTEAISAGEGGKIYDTLADAQALDPKPVDGTIFQVSGEGYYSFQSSETGGTRFEKGLSLEKSDLFESKNLFNPNDPEYVEGHFLNIDGSGILFENADYNTTGFIKIPTHDINDKIYFSKSSGSRRSRQVDFYDANKNVIPELHLNQNTDVGVVDIPNGVEYFRVTFEADITDYQIEIGNAATAYEPYKVSLKEEFLPQKEGVQDGEITPEKTTFFEISKNLFNPNDPDHVNGFLPSTGQIAPYETYNTTGYIEIPEHNTSDKIYLSKSGGYRRSRYVGFYDQNKTFLPDLHLNQNTDVGVVEIPDGASYFRVTYETDITDYQIEIGDSATSYQPYGLYIKKELIPELNVSVDSGNDSVDKEQYLGALDFQQPTDDINHVVMYGQSLSTGQQSAPSLSIQNFRGNLMIGDKVWFSSSFTDFQNLIANASNGATYEDTLNYEKSNQTACEAPVVGAANHLKIMLDRKMLGLADRKFLATSCGSGGKVIEELSKEFQNPTNVLYQGYLDSITTAKSIADNTGDSYNISCLMWMQGEFNYSAIDETRGEPGLTPGTLATADKDEYKALLKTLADNMIADAKAVSGQEKDPLFLTYQTANQYTKNNCSIGMAQLELSNEDPRVICAGGVYQVTDNGGHLCANGYRWFGEMMAKVAHRVLIEGKDFKPLQPTRISHSGNVITVQYHVPNPPLVFDTWTTQSKSNYGFEVFEDGVAKPITSVKIIGDTTVQIEVGSEITGECFVQYAGENMLGHGNLRDSDGYRSMYTYEELPAQLKPNYEPLDKEGGTPIYGQPYPLQNFSVQFHMKSL